MLGWMGKICVVDAKGRSSFQALQNVLSNAPGALVSFAFDLVYADGIDLRGAALVDRKRATTAGRIRASGRLTFVGKVGTGFNDKSLGMLSKRLAAMPQAMPAFHNPPLGAEARRSHWVRPELVAEVAFTEWTNEGTLRHPSFQGLREDKPAREVVRERASE
jgi:ATP-dependent DNA ligase